MGEYMPGGAEAREVPRNPGKVIHEATGRRCGEVKDQAAPSAGIDPLEAESRGRSFRKLMDECRRTLDIDAPA